jgi:hypothetical protein
MEIPSASPASADSSRSPMTAASAPASPAGAESSRSPVKAASAPASLAGADSSRSPVKMASASALASGSPAKAASSPTSLVADGTASSGGSLGLRGIGRAVTKVGGANAASRAALANAVTGGVVVGGVAAAVYGVSNMIRYAKNEKTAKEAIKDTAKGSAGLGVSAGFAVAVADAVAGSALALGSAVVVPLAAGVAAAYASMAIWNKLFFKKRGDVPAVVER